MLQRPLPAREKPSESLVDECRCCRVKQRLTSIHDLYGRGCGVGRTLGVGGILGVGVARGVGVAVAVGVGVTVAVGVGVGLD